MFRKNKKAAEVSDAQPQAAQAPRPQSSSGYNRSELTTFDGKGNPSTIVYSTDALGRTVKTRLGRRGGH
ncbi:MAG: hypothetical protein ACR2HV_06495 [Acidimicrobiales bacterium]